MDREQFIFEELEYVRPDYDWMKKELKKVTERAMHAGSYDELRECMLYVDSEQKKFMETVALAYVRHCIDTRDEFYEKEFALIRQMIPTMLPQMIKLSQIYKNSSFKEDFEKEFGRQFFAQAELQEKSFCMENIPLMQREAELTDEYQKLMASCEIPFDGKVLNLYGIQKYFGHENRQVRKAAFAAYSDFYHQNEPRMEEIWDELIKVRNQMGRNLGYDNYIPLGYLNQHRSDYGVEEVALFRKQVEDELVPLCQKLYEAQAKRLGLSSIKAFDEKRIYPDGNAVPAGDADFMVAQAGRMYHAMSLETGEFIEYVTERHMMDLKNKPGKAATGFMMTFPESKSPFIFSCFNGTIADMQVLTHEMGHAFAGYLAMRRQPVYQYYTTSMDIAEIHSMAMEQFAYPYAEYFFGGQADKFRFAHLQEAITFVPFAAAVDEFQHICYANPELSPKERTYEWHKLEKKYMPWRKYENDEFMERGGYWYHKLHIFIHPMYYINYAFTTMDALEFAAKNAKNHEQAWEDYLKLCRCGASLGYKETLQYANLSVPFEPGSVARAVKHAKEELLKRIENLV